MGKHHTKWGGSNLGFNDRTYKIYSKPAKSVCGGGGDGLRGLECCRQRKTINKEEKVIGEEKGWRVFQDYGSETYI